MVRLGNYPRFSPVLRDNQGSRDVYFKLFYKMADMCKVARVIIGNGAMEYISLEVMQLRVQLQDYTNAPGIMPISDYNGGF